MLSMSKFLPLAVLSTLLFSSSSFVSADLNPIKIDQSAFVDSVTGSRWIMKGSGYDYDVSDANSAAWKPALETLLTSVPGLNTLRLYVVDPSQQYTQFMSWAESQGLYVIVPLTGASGCAVLNNEGVPDLASSSSCYPSCLLNWGQQVVNIFSQFPNTLAYAIANEVMDSQPHWQAAPCVKAYVRDIKTYQYSCTNYGVRYVPVIYTAADNPIDGYTAEANDRLKLDYLTCSSDESSRIDAFGMNLFRWCSDTCTYETCDQPVVDALSGNGAPLLVTEYGCDKFALSSNPSTPAQRDWKETGSLYSSPVLSTFSGASAYTYGIRGGDGFAFFLGGSQDATGQPGMTKNCGYPNGQCNVDNYASQLGAVGNSVPTITNSDPSNRNYTCPTVLNFDLTVPPTRQGANGYVQVNCPVNSNSGSSSSSNSNTNTNTNTNTGSSSSSSSSSSNTNTNTNTNSSGAAGTSTNTSGNGSTSNNNNSNTNTNTNTNINTNTNSGNSTTSANGDNKNSAAGMIVSPLIAAVSVAAVTVLSWLF